MYAPFIILEGFKFLFVQELNLKCDSTGRIQQYTPQDNFGKYDGKKLNNHGSGPFCKFSIGSEWTGRCGVYALFVNDELLYIGRCQDLSKRFNSGYGYISYRNRLHDGQSTNCKINSMVLKHYHEGNEIGLYFNETNEHKHIENILLRKLNPPYNSTKHFISYSQSQNKKSHGSTIVKIPNKNELNFMTIEELKNKFHDDMVKYHHIRISRGYDAIKIGESIQKIGGYETAKKFIGANPTSGFINLVNKNLLNYSVEALVLQPTYTPIFTDKQRNICKKLLETYGYKITF